MCVLGCRGTCFLTQVESALASFGDASVSRWGAQDQGDTRVWAPGPGAEGTSERGNGPVAPAKALGHGCRQGDTGPGQLPTFGGCVRVRWEVKKKVIIDKDDTNIYV